MPASISSVKFKFVSPDASQEQQVEYSFCYEGDNMIGGSKFGGYGCSEIKTATTGQVIEIPSKRIISYLPASHFTYLLINADKTDIKQGDCTWTASMWTDENEGLLGKEQQLKEAVNEFLFRNTKDRIVEVKCL